MLRFTGTEVGVFAIEIGSDSFLARAHLARCARAIFNRESFDIKRFGADGDADADAIPVG
jgi:hypothetical protein